MSNSLIVRPHGTANEVSTAARPCPFCGSSADARAEARVGSAIALLDEYPVTPLHHLIVPVRHVATFFEMTWEEQADTLQLLDVLRQLIQARDPEVVGFNVGMNCGEVAGQTVLHAHVHLIPRRRHDMEDPRGGVRGVIPDKRLY